MVLLAKAILPLGLVSMIRRFSFNESFVAAFHVL